MQTNGKVLAFLLAAAFLSGYLVGHRSVPPTAVARQAQPVVQGQVRAAAHTVVAYTPRPEGDKTDFSASIGKPEIVVQVNGQQAVFAKDSAEAYALQKNKLTLDQSSRVEISVKVPEIDRTRNNALTALAGVEGLGLGYRHDRWGVDLCRPWAGGYSGTIRYDLLQW